MVSLTEQAAQKIKSIVEERKLSAETGIRVGIKGGGCAGFGYFFDFDDKIGEFDSTYEAHGVKVIVDRKSLLYIDGTVVDFNHDLMDHGFKFTNPKADTSCGCGTSFTPKQDTMNF